MLDLTGTMQRLLASIWMGELYIEQESEGMKILYSEVFMTGVSTLK